MATTPLKAHREQAKLTLSAVAKQLGISESQLSRIERQGTDSLDLALRLAKITNTRPEDFRKRAAA